MGVSLDPGAAEIHIGHRFGINDRQAVVAELPHRGRYGYAARPEAAPLTSWIELLHNHLARNRASMIPLDADAAEVLETCAALLSQVSPELDALPLTAFLPDTSTKNVIVTDDGKFSGIVDVDELCYRDPRQVAALTLASMSRGTSEGSVVYNTISLQPRLISRPPSAGSELRPIRRGRATAGA